MTKKGYVLSIDTVKKHIAMFRACYRKGLHEQNLQFPTDPFYGLKFEKSNVVKAKLTMEEIDNLPLHVKRMLIAAEESNNMNLKKENRE